MPEQSKTVLGLDIGTNSIGWAFLEVKGEQLVSIKGNGVRIFEEGVKKENQKEISLNQERRQARATRRLIRRKSDRMHRLLVVLQNNSLLPDGELNNEENILSSLMKEDPYILRERALYEFLEPYLLGRAIYHLAQHRGFLSNRKSVSKDSEEEEKKGKMKISFLETAAEMKEINAATYGEFLANLNPHEQRRRGRYILRQWIEDEFEKIWGYQEKFHPKILTPELKKSIEKIIFYQRPLKSVKNLIGKCQLEPHKRRAPMSFPAAQRLRMLQMINDTRIQYKGKTRKLTQEERLKLREKLTYSKTLTFSKARKFLDLPKNCSFNMENGGREEFLGESTVPEFMKIFEDKWESLTDQDKKQLFEDWWSYTNEDALVKRMQNKWQLPLEKAKTFASLKLENGYSAFSRKALAKLNPFLERGLSLQEAISSAYDSDSHQVACKKLPPLENFRNPVVQRSLSELRKVTNDILIHLGKPDLIRVELTRDLKNSSSTRQKILNKQLQRERERKKCAEKIIEEVQIKKPSYRDIEKAMLFKECNGICPYTGKNINFQDLFGPYPLFDIEHIIPFSRCLDDSFNNKTLCYVDENRNYKKDRTPWEAYGQEPEKWWLILRRVEKFNNFEKMRRFLIQDTFNDKDSSFWKDFVSQQLNDTRYITKVASHYLEQLYDSDKKINVQAIKSGKITAYFRNAWNLNNILGDGIKNRNDHRHHAIDAIVIGLTTPSSVKNLSIASKKSFRPGSFDSDTFPKPCADFYQEVKRSIEKIIVSHRASYKINGSLHKEKMYGYIETNIGENVVKAVIRKPLRDLSQKDVDKIVDPVVKAAVKSKLKEFPGVKPSNVFTNIENHPLLLSKDGASTPIHKVRVFQNDHPKTIGGERNKRNVMTSNNHHLELYLSQNKNGEETYQGKVITNLEIMQALAKLKKNKSSSLGESLYPSQNEKGDFLAMILFKGDMVKVNWKGKRCICVVQSISEKDIILKLHNDARIKKEKKNDLIRFRSYAKLHDADIEKISVSPAGSIS